MQGVSTRKVDALVRSLGMEGISKGEVSRIPKELDKTPERFRGRPLTSGYPLRVEGRVVLMAAVGAAEGYEFRPEFSPVARGFVG